MALVARELGQRIATPGALFGEPAGSYVAAEALWGAVATQTISPSGIASAEAFGTPSLIQVVKPGGIASGEAFGTPTVTPGAVTISPSSITSGEAFGTPVVTRTGDIFATGIPSEEAFGTPTVQSDQDISPTGIPSAEAFGTPSLRQIIEPTGIPSAEAFGTPTVTIPPQVISPSGIPSEEAFGDFWSEDVGALQILPPGIPSAEAFGTPTVTDGGPTTISPTGIPSEEAFGSSVERPLVWLSIDDEPSPPTRNPPSTRPAPRAQLINDRTGEVYNWPINHSDEDEFRLARSMQGSGPNPEVGLGRQQGYGDDPRLTLNGTILDRAQLDEFNDFFEQSDDDELRFIDPLGAEYLVIISTFDAQLQRTPANPHDPDSRLYWRYKVVLFVLEARAGELEGLMV